MADRYPWDTMAECNQEDGDLWFSLEPIEKRVAIRICNRCPVRDDCLEYALDNHIHYGIWGGLTEDERRKLKRQRSRSA